MTERMKRFFEAAVKSDNTLEKLKNLKGLSFAGQTERITALAAEVGITLTENDFRQLDGAELTDEEMEKTAGGGVEEKLSLDELMALMMMETSQTERERREARKPL